MNRIFLWAASQSESISVLEPRAEILGNERHQLGQRSRVTAVMVLVLRLRHVDQPNVLNRRHFLAAHLSAPEIRDGNNTDNRHCGRAEGRRVGKECTRRVW